VVDALTSIQIREANQEDRDWLTHQLRGSWGSTTVVSRGQPHDASALPAFVAVDGDERVGLATIRYDSAECELVTLDALRKQRGIGSALLDRVAEAARDRGCMRLWLITSNDNLEAIRFYQRRGMRLTALHRGAVDEARRLKPSIPEVGEYGIPLHDELEFELRLESVDE
jgi:ribosomal protein S18 acetylase RimI-like enzyme